MTKLLAATAAALLLPFPAAAQSMPGMPMPGGHAHTVPARAKPVRKPATLPAPRPRKAQQPARTPHDEAETAPPPPASETPAMPEGTPGTNERRADTAAMDHGGMDHSGMDEGGMDHATMPMPGDGMAAMDMPGMGMAMRAPAARPGECEPAGGTFRCLSQNGSGSSRLPAAEPGMQGLHGMAGGWMLMAHGYAWGMVTDQGGPRGRNEPVVQSMAMLQADRDIAAGTHLQLRTMLSLEPLMGAKGYPNLFATGETANGIPLVDRQHPHDLFMELAGRVDVNVGHGALFVYGGPVAEPALGPAAFMHRGSAVNMPLAPITHHWFDSTHITYGVVTAGYATPHLQLEASAFRGREPDERRWNIETPRLDSWSVRASWSPSPALLVQASHGRLASPEVEHAGQDEGRTTASVQYAAGGVTTTLAWSLKDRLPGHALSAWLAEANWVVAGPHSVFARIEHVANDELFPDHSSPLHDRVFRVARFEGGYAYRVGIAGPLGMSLGGALAAYAKPAALDAAYGRAPVSWTLFAKLSLGH